MLVGAGGRGKGLLLIVTVSQFCKMERILGMAEGNGCTTMQNVSKATELYT